MVINSGYLGYNRGGGAGTGFRVRVLGFGCWDGLGLRAWVEG